MLIHLWLTHYTPRESRERLSVFLRDWVRRDACRNRVRAQSAAGVAQLWEDCFEPMTMALGGPGNIWPDAWENQDPTRRLAQADFDRRLANWLRDVIRQKRVSALKSLAKALELLPCDLSMGITAEKIKASVGQMAEKGSGLSRKRRIIEIPELCPADREAANQGGTSSGGGPGGRPSPREFSWLFERTRAQRSPEEGPLKGVMRFLSRLPPQEAE